MAVRYSYDTWSNILTTTGSMANTLGVQNPLRYRGYVYDQETGLCYLQSRYYNPDLGRFLSPDAFASTGQGILGNNMFAYCLNNPVNYSDASGSAAAAAFGSMTDPLANPWKDPTTGGGLGAALGALGAVVLSASTSKEEMQALVDAKLNTAEPDDDVYYYGVDMRGGAWKYVTPAMNYHEALAWVSVTAVSHYYGKKASWGIYTSKQQNAYEIAVALGGPIPIIHTNRPGEYPHYHVMGMILFGEYKHFHIWYGSIFGGA